jgi:hypothetical protein
MIPDIKQRAEEAAGVPAAVAHYGYLIRYIICYLISYRIRHSPSAATLTDVAVQLALGRKEEEEEEEEVLVYGGLLGRQEKGSSKM